VLRALRVGWLARWSSDLRVGGTRRMFAAWQGAMVAAAVAVFSAATLVVTARVHDSFQTLEGPTVAVVLMSVVTPLAVLAALAAHLVFRRFAPSIVARSHWLAGRRAWLAGAVPVIAIIALPVLVIHCEIPIMNLDPVISSALTVGSVVALRLVDVSRFRAARVTALALAVAIVAGAAMIGRAEQARLIAVESGSYSKLVAKAIWRLADRDGDGYAAAWAGGADCDDSDPTRSPGRLDIAGNGIDENCTGADATRVALPERAPHSAEPESPSPNILLISVDALRADHLGAWGYARPTSPSIDRFAGGAARFAAALTASPATKHALPAMLTGRHASANLRGAPATSIAEVLRDGGWDTRAVMCCQRIRSPADLRGFTSVDTSADDVRLHRPGQANADAVADTTIDWLRHGRQRAGAPPFFLWVHFYDPHDPYEVPPGGPQFGGGGDVDRYDSEVAFVDRGIGRVLDAIDQLGLTGTTIVAITADHGEEFGEHGIRFHAHSLYNQVVGIPLIVRAPGCRPRVIDAPVSLIDLAPTLLELAGVTEPPGWLSHSLAPEVCGETNPTSPVLVELIPERFKRDAVAMVTDRWKVIWDREANAWLLFERGDRDDRHDVSASEPAVLAIMKAQLFEQLDRELGVAGRASPSATAAAH
jgi:arylsulfatase A-like enzyme